MSTILRNLILSFVLVSSVLAQTKVREGNQTQGALPSSQGGVPAGGLTDQILSKINGSDYNYHWTDPTSGGASAFLELTDVPHSYSGEANKIVQVNSSGTGLHFSTQAFPVIPQNFTELNDVPSSYVGFNGRFVMVNATATGVMFASPTPTPTPSATATATATPTPSATPLSIFKTILVAGQDDVVADSNADVLNLVAGNAIIVTTDGTTDTITLAVATPTATATFTPTPTATSTATPTATPTPSATATATPTATAAAPEDAHYVTTQSETGLSNEFNLGGLLNGILYQSVSGSVSTPAIVSIASDLKFSAPNLSAAHSVTFNVEGAGIVLGSGTKNPQKLIYGGTLIGWIMMCKPSGSVTADVFRAADGAGLPVTSIVGGGGTKPAIASDVENSSTSFSGWTSTTLTAKDNLAISLSGITASTFVTLTLYYK